MYKQIAQAIKPLLDKRAKSDTQFAKDYKRTDKSIEEFAKLFYDACSKGRNGGNAVFGSDDMLVAQAVHYYHEDKVEANDINLDGIAIVKKSSSPTTPKPTKSSPTTPKPKPKAAIDDDDFDFDFDDDDKTTPTPPAPTMSIIKKNKVSTKSSKPTIAKPIAISEEDDFDID